MGGNGSRQAGQVHQADGNAQFGDGGSHVGVGAQRADVVDHGRARLHARAGHVGLIGVHGERNVGQAAARAAMTGRMRRSSSSSGQRSVRGEGGGTGGFAADVENIRALRRHLPRRARPPAAGSKNRPPSEKLVGRDVEDAHDEGALALSGHRQKRMQVRKGGRHGGGLNPP